MIPNDNQRIQKYYKQSLERYGDHDARSVHWSDRQNQQTRFLVLTQIADLNGTSILDVGCGLGDLYTFFLKNRIDVAYTGIDIIPDFIVKARERYPQGKFLLQDMTSLSESFDYILASGALSFKVEDHKNFYFGIIKKMFEHAKKGVAFNMLNHDHHLDDDTYAAYDMNEVADFCKTFCDRVEIVTDYLPQDFTIYLYK